MFNFIIQTEPWKNYNKPKKKKNNLNNYQEWLENQNLSPVTVRGYTNGIRHYGENKSLTNKEISEFFKSKVEKLAPNSLKNIFFALQSYAKFQKIGDVNWKIIRKTIPEIQKGFFDTIDEKELEQLKQARFEKWERTYQRNNLILDFLFYTGIRVNELVNVKHKDYNYQQRTLQILGKGNKMRYVFLPDFLVKHFNSNSPSYFFQGLNGNASKSLLSTRVIESMIRQRVKKLGINKHITPHSFRRSFATNLYNKCKKLTTVQKLLGHSNINTTANYIHNNFESLRADYNQIWEGKEVFGNFNDSIIYNKYHLSV